MPESINKNFYAKTIEKALGNCQKAGYRALFMPQLADQRIETEQSKTQVFKNFYCTLSLRATGKSPQGNSVVIYAHIPNYFSKPENVIKAKGLGLVNGAGSLPEKEFQRLLKREDSKKVFVIDHSVLKTSSSGVIPVEQALEHPQTIPFLGGRERAEKYLEKHLQVYGNTIGIWHCDDLDENTPCGRLLFLGSGSHNGLNGNYILDSDARFLGVREKIAEGDAKKIMQVYTPKEIISTLRELKLSRLEAQILAELKKRKK